MKYLLASCAFAFGSLACAAETVEQPEEPFSNNQGTGGSGAGGVTSSGGSAGSSSTGYTPPVTSAGASSSATGGSGGTSTAGASGGSSTAGGTGNSGGSINCGSNTSNAAGAELLFEDFEDGKANGWIASVDDENLPLGAWAVASGVYQQSQATSDPTWAVGGCLSWGDQFFETKVMFDASSALEDATVFIAARFQTFDRYYFVEFRGDGNLKIRSRVDGSTQDLGAIEDNVPLTAGTWYAVGLKVKGSTIEAYLDGVLAASGSDAVLTTGGIGLAARDAIVSFDDVRVTVP
jgi:hypothetical protein